LNVITSGRLDLSMANQFWTLRQGRALLQPLGANQQASEILNRSVGTRLRLAAT
jgi:hypothetical protein